MQQGIHDCVARPVLAEFFGEAGVELEVNSPLLDQRDYSLRWSASNQQQCDVISTERSSGPRQACHKQNKGDGCDPNPYPERPAR